MTENLTFNDLPQAVTMLTKEVSELKRLFRITSYNVCYTKLLRSDQHVE